MTDKTEIKKVKSPDVYSILVPGNFDGHTFDMPITTRVWKISVQIREALGIDTEYNYPTSILAREAVREARAVKRADAAVEKARVKMRNTLTVMLDVVHALDTGPLVDRFELIADRVVEIENAFEAAMVEIGVEDDSK